ncbi:MAG TPA: hypothetical protein VF320_08520, partial [Acidimicrobiales bacterium]
MVIVVGPESVDDALDALAGAGMDAAVVGRVSGRASGGSGGSDGEDGPRVRFTGQEFWPAAVGDDVPVPPA